MFAVFAALTLAMSRVGGVLTYQGSPVSGNVLKHRPISHYTVTLPAPAAKKKERKRDDRGRGESRSTSARRSVRLPTGTVAF
jgi:hypothetical protein